MNWNQQFAQRTQQMKRSAVRELLKLASQPEMISFAGGLPAAELFPIPRIQAAVQSVLLQVGGQSLQYAQTEGIPALRDWVARYCSRPPFHIQPENVLITSGSQQALDLLGKVFLNEADPVIVENPTYLALLSAWRPYNPTFISMPSDREGMRVELLESGLRQCPKMVYIVPNFQNPQGTTLSQSRREQLVALLHQYEVALVEDNPYGDLRYSGTPLPGLLEMESEPARNTGTSSVNGRVIYTGTFSKVLMPGLRVGWVIAPCEVIDKLVQAKQASDLHTSTFSQYVALELLNQGYLEECLPVLRKVYRERRDCMLAAMQRYFPPDIAWTKPDGGMFLFVTLPQTLSASDLLPLAIRQRVAFVPGEEFHLNGEGRNTLRLNFSHSRPDQIEAGIKRLANVVCASEERIGYQPESC